MIVSPGRRYIFVHIPKTGGTALSLALEARAMADDLLIGDTPKALRRRQRLKALTPRGKLWKHSTRADIDGTVAAPVIDRALIVTMVRNPWDRLVSYYHWLREVAFDHPVVTLARKHDFAGFVAHPAVADSLRRSPARVYVTDAAGRERPALFIRLEAFDDDAAPFFAHLGFRFALPVANVSGRARDYRGYYSDCTAALVADVCAEDIARFGYRF